MRQIFRLWGRLVQVGAIGGLTFLAVNLKALHLSAIAAALLFLGGINAILWVNAVLVVEAKFFALGLRMGKTEFWTWVVGPKPDDKYVSLWQWGRFVIIDLALGVVFALPLVLIMATASS